MYDIAIVGSGPAGVSAAITGKVRNKDILLLGDRSVSKKMRKAEKVLNYPGFPEISGAELADRFSDHLASLDIDITEDSITQIYDMGKYFALQGKSGSTYEARTVILAMGVVAAKAIEGEEENLGMGVSYCATCDAPLYRGKTAAVIAYSAKEEKEAEFLAELAEKVIYIPVYKGCSGFERENITVINEKVVSIGAKGKTVITENSEISTDGVFVLRDSVAPKNLIYGLEMDGAHIKTDRQCRTSVKGVFACGDVTGKPYQFAKAVGEGNTAVLSAVDYLDDKAVQ